MKFFVVVSEICIAVSGIALISKDDGISVYVKVFISKLLLVVVVSIIGSEVE